VVDRRGATLPLQGNGHWTLLAISGGHPITVTGEWSGLAFTPLGVIEQDRFTPLVGA
jgi:hypothetical protein